MWKNIIEPDGPQMTIWHMRIRWWMPKATNTYSEYVTLHAFPQQQWLHERAIPRSGIVAVKLTVSHQVKKFPTLMETES